MVYLMRLILWLVIILLISWIIHKVGRKFVKNEKIKPFIGVITFVVIIFTPVTIAKIVQVYYCSKYQPFYKIIEPLGDDFEGYYGKGSFRDAIKKYPSLKSKDYIINLVRKDAIDDLPDVYKHLAKGKKEGLLYIREYIDKQGSDNCYIPRKESNIEKLIKIHKEDIEKIEEEGKQVKEGKIFQKNPDSYVNYYLKNKINEHLESIEFLESGKCIARKVIPESEVSRYVLGGKQLAYKKILNIPGIVYAWYSKGPVFTDRLTGKPFAWGQGVSIAWDLYGVSGHEGAKPHFYCGVEFSLVKKMIEEKGVKDGNK